jgi:hypothetical protein
MTMTAIRDAAERTTYIPLEVQPKRLENGWHFEWATFYDNGIVHTWDDDGTGGENWNANGYPQENKIEQAMLRSPHSRVPVSTPVLREGVWVWEVVTQGAST